MQIAQRSGTRELLLFMKENLATAGSLTGMETELPVSDLEKQPPGERQGVFLRKKQLLKDSRQQNNFVYNFNFSTQKK